VSCEVKTVLLCIILTNLRLQKSILSSERMLHKDYDSKDSVARNFSGRESQGACREDELISGKPPVVK
jgi:hypothetical protein